MKVSEMNNNYFQLRKKRHITGNHGFNTCIQKFQNKLFNTNQKENQEKDGHFGVRLVAQSLK
jgi:hypothetical protein